MHGLAPQPGRLLLLTGPPGAGKTTLVTRLAQRIGPAALGGFTTAEIREGGRRVGFRLVTFDDESRIIAHHELQTGHSVGRYGVDVAAIDAVADRALDPGAGWGMYLIDEIGKMECLAPRFVTRVRGLLASDRPVIATVAQKGGGLIAEIRRRPEAELWTIDPRDPEAFLEAAADWARLRGINA